MKILALPRKCIDLLLMLFIGLIIPFALSWIFLFLLALIRRAETAADHDLYNLLASVLFFGLVFVGVRLSRRIFLKAQNKSDGD